MINKCRAWGSDLGAGPWDRNTGGNWNGGVAPAVINLCAPNVTNGILFNDTGAFDGFAEGATITFDSQQFKTTYLADSTGNSFTGGNDFVLNVIPEPGDALLGSLGMLTLRRRRHRFIS